MNELVKHPENEDLVEFTPVPTVIDYWDVENPRSVISEVSQFSEGIMAMCMEENREQLEFLLSEEEEALRKRCLPSPETNLLRLKFWDEFSLAQRLEQPMNLRRVVEGIIPENMFYLVIRSLDKLAWILKCPKKYEDKISEFMDRALVGVSEILDSSIKNEDGSYSSAVISAKLKAFSMLDNRIKGMPKNTTVRKSVSVNIHKKSKDLKGVLVGAELSEEEKLAQELMNSRQELAKVEYDPRVIVVPPLEKK